MTRPGGRICAVLGSPIGHSLSPVLHRAAYAALGLDRWTYRAVECDQDGLAALVGSCGPSWAGLSLTMPLKRAVLPLLTDAEPLVTQVGAANTLVFGGGRRSGYNTDVTGMIAALAGAGPQAGPALILGAGATACAALAALRAIGIGDVTAAVREPGRAGPLLAAAGRLGVPLRCCPFDAAQVDGTALVISAVPAGGADFFAAKLLTAARPPAALLDVVYHPWPTKLAQTAAQAGSVVIGGFELLLHQAARQVELMTGRAAPVEAMRAAGRAELARRAGQS